jgi:tight adherence protein B
MESLQEILLNPYVLPVAGGLAILLLFLGLRRVERSRDALIEQRLGQYGRIEDEEVAMRGERRSTLDGLEAAVTRRSFAATLQTELARANLQLRVSEFIALTLLSVAAFFLLGYLIFDSLFLGLVFGVVGFFVPRFYVGFRQRRRLNAFNDQLGDTISLLANSIRSGFSIVQSMETAAQQLPEPVASEFQRVTQEIGLGVHYEDALINMLRRVPSEDLELMVIAINIQGRIGGNLAEILDTIGHTIRERVRIKGEIRVLTAQQMISGYILVGLPIILGMALYLLNREYIARMFSDPCGWIMLGVAALMLVSGFLIVRRIVDIEV